MMRLQKLSILFLLINLILSIEESSSQENTIDESKHEIKHLETNLDVVDSGGFGIMFDILALRDVVITGISIYSDVTEELNYEIYIKNGTFLASKNSLEEWTLATKGQTKGLGGGKLTPTLGFTETYILQEKVLAIYITLDSFDLRYANTNLNIGDIMERNEDLLLEAGQGIHSYPLNGGFSEKAAVFRGAIHYFDPFAELVSEKGNKTEETISENGEEIANEPLDNSSAGAVKTTNTSSIAISSFSPSSSSREPVPTLPPRNYEVETQPPHGKQEHEQEMVEGCTKQLIYVSGQNLGLVTLEYIKFFERIILQDLNKTFHNIHGNSSQILSVTVVDQQYNPNLSPDSTVVTLILGKFPHNSGFVFDTEVQQIFEDVGQKAMLPKLKQRIYVYEQAENVFSVIDWDMNATEVLCGKTDAQEEEEIEEEESPFYLTSTAFILYGIAAFFTCICGPLCYIQRRKMRIRRSITNEYSDEYITRLAELYAKNAYSSYTKNNTSNTSATTASILK